MGRLLVLAVLAALAVAEVAAVMALIDWLGPLGASLVLAADVVMGLFVMRWAVRGPQRDRGFRLTAGAFIALPGLVLDLVGVLLLVPPVREWIRRSVVRGTESALRRSGLSVVTVTAPGEVIPGTVVVEETVVSETIVVEDATAGPGTPQDRVDGSPSPGPRVVRGEIVSGEVVEDDRP